MEKNIKPMCLKIITFYFNFINIHNIYSTIYTDLFKIFIIQFLSYSHGKPLYTFKIRKKFIKSVFWKRYIYHLQNLIQILFDSFIIIYPDFSLTSMEHFYTNIEFEENL